MCNSQLQIIKIKLYLFILTSIVNTAKKPLNLLLEVSAQKLEMTNNEDAKNHLVIATKSQKIQLKNVL